MPKFINPWTPEKLKSFSYSALVDMKEKAVINDHKDLVEWCDFELSTRPPPPPVDPNARKPRASVTRKNGRAPSIVAAEKELNSQLEKLGRSLLEKYDLSKETAKKLSKGSKFRAHSFLSKVGRAKVGGAKRKGRVAINSFISYRLKTDIFGLAGVLEHNHPAEEMSFMVLAPKEYVNNFVSVNELLPSLEETDDIGLVHGGESFANFDDAAALFTSIIEQVAPRKS